MNILELIITVLKQPWQLTDCRLQLCKTLDRIEKLELLLQPNFELGEIVEKDGEWIDDVLKANIRYWQQGVSRMPLDSKYFLAGQEDIQKIIAWDWVDSKKYVNKFDCENFSLWFKARVDGIFQVNQVGLVIDWSSTHAYNCIVLPDERLLLIEPQSDEYWDIGDHDYKKPFKLEHATILI